MNMINNGNGKVMADRMSYDDLYNELQDDRDYMIRTIVETRIDEFLKTQDIMELLMDLYVLNDIYYEPEFYLQDEKVLYDIYYNHILDQFESKTNEEIVEFFRIEEPYVFGIADALQALFDQSPDFSA